MATTFAEENERLAREYFDRLWNHGTVNTDVLADDYHVVAHIGERVEYTREEFHGTVAHLREAFPDLHKKPQDVIATDGTVVIRYTFTGTQEGELMGISPTTNEVEISAVDIIEMENGKIVKEWYLGDFLRMMRQLGVAD